MAKVPIKVKILDYEDDTFYGYSYVFVDDFDDSKTKEDYPEIKLGEKFPEKLSTML